MTKPKVSERMFNLVECAVAAAYSWPKPICIVDVPSEEIIKGYYLQMLLSAIAEIEQRAEKAEQERDLLMKEPNNRLDGYRELGAKCAALEEQVEKWAGLAVAVYTAWRDREGLPKLERAEALRALGQMRDEAVSPQKGEG